MCGIAGILGRIDDRNRGALERMSDAMVHRGPDAAGVWESPADGSGLGAMLAHRRLAILDLSPAGAQPMVDAATGHVIVYNGEVFNYRALRERLTGEGQEFRSTGDTAVVLRALGVHGRRAVSWLRGMFAFAVWDPKERSLLLARDSLGIKPLYFALGEEGGGWSLAFASEVRALLASGLLGKARLDPRATASVVWNGFVAGPGTAVAGVESMSPGELRVFRAARRADVAREYFRAPPSAHAPPTDEEGLSRALDECVELHLASDVPLGIFLSSGVDSSAVANIARRAAKTPVHTFTLAFEELELDEGRDARRIAGAIGTQHHEVTLSEAHFVERLDAALDSLDQPTFDGLNSFYMSHAVRDAGFTVALVGTGGDELFGGYTTFRDLPALRRWARLSRALPRGPMVAAARAVAAALGGTGGAFPPQTRWAKLPAMVRAGDDLISLYQLAYALFLPDTQRQLLGGEAAGLLADGLSTAMRARLEREIAGRSSLSAISVLEQRLFLAERLLRDNDAASMAASIEQRLPLVDQALTDVVDRLPDGARYSPVGKKALLRRVGLRGLDPALFNRPKAGFVLPFDRWIRRGLHATIDATLRDASAVRGAGLEPEPVARLWRAFVDGAPGIYWSRVWAVFVLVRWCNRYGVLR